MELLDVLYIVLIICSILITGSIIIVAYQAKLTMERARITLGKIDDLSTIPDAVKQRVEAGVFGFAGWILQKLTHRR